jgi:signal transduction histidine kinase
MRELLRQHYGRILAAYACILALALLIGSTYERRLIAGELARNAEDFAVSFEPLIAHAMTAGDELELERLAAGLVAGYLIEAVEITASAGDTTMRFGEFSTKDTGPWALFMPRLPPQAHPVRDGDEQVATLVIHSDRIVVRGLIQRNVIRIVIYATLLASILLVILLLSLLTRELAEARDAARESLREIARLEQTALQLTESIPVGTYVLSTNRGGVPRFTFISDRWLKLLDADRESVIADPNNAWIRAHPEDYAQFVALNLEVMRNIKPFHWVGRILVRGEVRWLEVESVPRALADGGHAWEGVIIDITAYKRAEEELIRLHERLTALEVEKTRVEERSRLLQDVHDGFGSQLTTARLQAEQGQINPARMSEILQECMADLHLVVDTLGQQDISLADALTDFRFRTQRRLFDSPVVLHWEIALDAAPQFPADESLRLLRIVQEALNNALRHARASQIWISVVWHPQRGLMMSVKDDGVGLPTELRPGRGMLNMQGRARELGASLEMVRRERSGTSVKLVLPAKQQAA